MGGGEPALHSHITGVAPGGQHRGIGFALKVHQRAWARARDVNAIGWTFDPLVARNAWFNLAKLAAMADTYLEDFYGPMTDGINAGMESDRLWLWWNLGHEHVVAACAGTPYQPSPAGAEELLAVGPDQEPALHQTDAPVVTVAVPPDIERLDGDQRRRWRRAVREVLGGALAEGWYVSGFLRHPDRYVVER
jgi:predicted GNAT superfamily acetyltransferase